MLPTSKRYLTKAGWSPRASAYALIGLFLAGVIVISLVSGLIHRYIPSHVVDCAHTHEPEHDPERGPESHEHARRNESERLNDIDSSTERTPLLKRIEPRSFKSTPAVVQAGKTARTNLHKEPLRMRLTRQLSVLVGGVKPLCDENGPCYGFSQTCGGECTKTLIGKPSNLADENARPLRHHRSLSRFQEPTWPGDDEESGSPQVPARWPQSHPRALSEGAQRMGYLDENSSSSYSKPFEYRCESPDYAPSEHVGNDVQQQEGQEGQEDQQHPPQHHHHVPQNAFLSIGLQTSVAIALHKLPEGFITYATNHASPTLGMTVFLALFIHNISEGFAMALPLYLALHSRWKAMFWSSLLGGISQPAGAGLAALWIWGSQKASGDHGPETSGPSWGVYGGLFAATAGIMTSVALQLFSEGLSLTHNRGLGIGFAIAGMGLMGLSFALTA